MEDIKNSEFKIFIENLIDLFKKYNINDDRDLRDYKTQYFEGDIVDELIDIYDGVKYQDIEDVVKYLDDGLNEYPYWFIYHYMKKNMMEINTYFIVYLFKNQEYHDMLGHEILNMIDVYYCNGEKNEIAPFWIKREKYEIKEGYILREFKLYISSKNHMGVKIRKMKNMTGYYLIIGETEKYFKCKKLKKNKLQKYNRTYYIKNRTEDKITMILKDNINYHMYDKITDFEISIDFV